MEELLSLKWNNHRSTFLHILGVLRDKQAYTDVTLACDGKFYSVHKLVLSTCSDYFCAMFDKTACKSPVIVLKDIKCEDLEALLDYMYLGEVNVRQSDLASLIKAAENLRIKGLAVPDDEPSNKSGATPAPRPEVTRREGGSGSPPAKRKRRDEGEDGREDVRPPSGLHTPPLPLPQPARPKSPVSQQLSPSPHRTSQESPATEERVNRPHSSPVDSSITSQTSSQPPPSSSNTTTPAAGNQFRTEETPSFVKVEMEDDATNDMHGDSYDMSADGYKEEADDSGGGMNSDLPEFLQAAASGALTSSTASYHPSFAGPSGYQPGDLANWQGDGSSSLGFPAHLNFSSSDGSSQQNAPGNIFQMASIEETPVLSSRLKVKSLFEEKLKPLVDNCSDRSDIFSNERYNLVKGEVKEAKRLRANKEHLSSKHYRRLKRFDVITIGEVEKLIEKQVTDDYGNVRYYCKTDELFDALEAAHMSTGHKRTRVMEAELKKKYCNVTRQVIDIYLSVCEQCQLKKENCKRRIGNVADSGAEAK